jgi:hypothetical protein
MIHGDAVADADGIEYHWCAAGGINPGFDGIHQLVQMDVARDDFVE